MLVREFNFMSNHNNLYNNQNSFYNGQYGNSNLGNLYRDFSNWGYITQPVPKKKKKKKKSVSSVSFSTLSKLAKKTKIVTKPISTVSSVSKRAKESFDDYYTFDEQLDWDWKDSTFEEKPQTQVKKEVQKVIAPPIFMAGFEFEGIVREECWNQFKVSLKNLSPHIQLGTDNSIRNIPSGYRSVEIRTSTLTLEKGLLLLEELFCFFYIASQENDFITNDTCGFHINVSEKGLFAKEKQVDFYCNILKDFDEERVLKAFDRLNNRYCKRIFKEDEEKDIEKINKRFKNNLDGDKYLSVSLRGSPQHGSYNGPSVKYQRVEFRCLGNKDYHLKFNELEDSINHIHETIVNSYEKCA